MKKEIWKEAGILDLEKAISCHSCGALHNASGESFFTFYGNVALGLNGGIIGNNFNEEGKLKGVTYLCRKKECLSSLLGYVEGNEI